MIGYYVHHQGRGHLHRCLAVAEAWASSGLRVTGLSSLPRPSGWRGPWVQLPADDRASDPVDVTANDQLHWAPLRDADVSARASVLSRWLEREHPSAVVVDVSVETALLVRLHGVPVVSMVLPGHRADPTHLLGFRASTALVACWPAAGLAPPTDLLPGLPDDVRSRIVCLGSISRFGSGVRRRTALGGDRAVLLQGRGGAALWEDTTHALERRTPGWGWTILGGCSPWVEDPTQVLAEAAVVVTSAGESSLADVAALRRPAVVVPSPRPFEEQQTTAAALRRGPWPVVVAADRDEALRPDTLARAAALDGRAWTTWSDGRAVERLRGVVESVAASPAARRVTG